MKRATIEVRTSLPSPVIMHSAKKSNFGIGGRARGAKALAAEPRIQESIPTPALFDLAEHRTGVPSHISTAWCHVVYVKELRLAVVLYRPKFSLQLRDKSSVEADYVPVV